jgi:hypothetical protein
MLIGKTVQWRGRAYVLRGFDPMGVEDACVHLEDDETGERIRVPFDDLVAEVSPSGEKNEAV